MITYMHEDEIVEINHRILKISRELHEYEYQRPDYIRFTLKFIEENFNNDLYLKALGYCVSIIVHHAFRNGNHRTSMITAEIFLVKNGYTSFTTAQKDIDLYSKRIVLEQKNDYDYIKWFFNSIESIAEIKNIMKSDYGILIENWLKENYKKV